MGSDLRITLENKVLERRRRRNRTLQEAMVETYFQQLDKPLHGFWRFLYATSGSLSFLVSGLFISVVSDDGVIRIEQAPYAPEVFTGLASIFFGFLISRGETRHGRVRLYIAGLLLPAFVIAVTLYAFRYVL